jgi:hypothetical protein
MILQCITEEVKLFIAYQDGIGEIVDCRSCIKVRDMPIAPMVLRREGGLHSEMYPEGGNLHAQTRHDHPVVQCLAHFPPAFGRVWR